MTAHEDFVHAFIEAFNAGDFERLEELLADGAEVRGIVAEAPTPARVLETLRLRSPWMSLARADLGHDPVAAIWVTDQDDRYQAAGFLSFETSGSDITRVELVEALPEDLPSETPSPAWVAAEVDTVGGELASGPALLD